jgi:hypothetical protein
VTDLRGDVPTLACRPIAAPTEPSWNQAHRRRVEVPNPHGGWRCIYQGVCRILTNLADAFFSSSWRIL